MQNQLITILFGMILILGLFGVPEAFLLMNGKDKFRKGFLIYKRNLSKSEINFLENLEKDIILHLPPMYSFFTPKIQGYILINNNQFFIQFRKLNWRTGLPYIGFVDLNLQNPCLEYRGVFFTHLALAFLLILVTLAGITRVWFVVLFIVFVLCLNFFIEKNSIDSFLLNEIKKLKKLKKTKSKRQYLST